MSTTVEGVFPNEERASLRTQYGRYTKLLFGVTVLLMGVDGLVYDFNITHAIADKWDELVYGIDNSDLARNTFSPRNVIASDTLFNIFAGMFTASGAWHTTSALYKIGSGK